jgi:uroporphyrinogen-III decarboxylase
MNFYDEPEAMHEIIAYITDWEMRQADELCAHLHCDAIFHHDDWGSQTSTFLAPDMFEDFFLEPYKALYGHYKELGVEVIVHHSDSYAATLVPDMIDMGIDVWQGVMTSNDIPSLIKKYGNKMTYMGGIDDAKVDYAGWSQDVVAVETKRACTECGKLNFIPCLTHGLNYGVFPGVYESVSEEIDKCSKEMF